MWGDFKVWHSLWASAGVSSETSLITLLKNPAAQGATSPTKHFLFGLNACDAAPRFTMWLFFTVQFDGSTGTVPLGVVLQSEVGCARNELLVLIDLDKKPNAIKWHQIVGNTAAALDHIPRGMLNLNGVKA